MTGQQIKTTAEQFFVLTIRETVIREEPPLE